MRKMVRVNSYKDFSNKRRNEETNRITKAPLETFFSLYYLCFWVSLALEYFDGNVTCKWEYLSV
jgi:hypothetical protein